MKKIAVFKKAFSALKIGIMFIIIFSYLMILPQCRKCQITCVQPCVAYWTDSTRTIMDTVCAKDFSTYNDFTAFLNNKAGSYLTEPKFKECKGTKDQLKNADCSN